MEKIELKGVKPEKKNPLSYRHVPLLFRYMHCDDMAEYLEKQAKKGWRFRGFRFGMEFEKSIPEDLHYDVQIFTKNRETDRRPEADTEEFADYCRAAGWEFVDSTRKFTVFRKMNDDAVPICTEEEKYQAVVKAEMGYFWRWAALALIWILNISMQIRLNLEFALFASNILILAYSFWILEGIIAVLRLPSILLWRKKQKENLRERGFAEFKGNMTLDYIVESRRFIYVLILIPCVALDGFVPNLWVWLTLLFAVGLFMAWFRPSRSSNLMIGIAVSFVAVIVIPVIVLSSSLTTEEKAQEMSGKGPLQLSDLCEVSGEEYMPSYEYGKTIFGTMEGAHTTYHTPGYIEAQREWYKDHYDTYIEDEGEQYINYRVIKSTHSWVIDKISDRSIEKTKDIFKDSMIDASSEWDAKEAYYYTSVRLRDGALCNHTYMVVYDDAYLTITTYMQLNNDQINIVRDKLGL